MRHKTIAAADPDPFVMVRFAYDYSRGYHPWEGRGYRDGLSGTLIGQGEGAIPVVAPSEAPVVASLRQSDPALGTYDVRMVDGAFMRPVRKPGSWIPCDVAGFLAAAGGAASWRDSPFTARAPNPHAKPKALAEIDLLSQGLVRKWALDKDKSVERLDAIRVALARMAVIGGVVHVPCPEPTLVLYEMSHKGGKRFEVVWHVGGLARHDKPDTGAYDASRDVAASAWSSVPTMAFKRAETHHYHSDEDKERANLAAEIGVFAYDREDDARRLALSMATDRIGYDAGTEPVVARFDATSSHRLDPLLSFLGVVKRSFANPREEWGGVLGASTEGIVAWAAARDRMASLPAIPTPTGIRDAFEEVEALMAHKRSPQILGRTTVDRIMDRWSACERDRDLDTVPGLYPDDVDPGIASFTMG